MLASTSSKVSTVEKEKALMEKEGKEEEFQTVVLGLIARYSRPLSVPFLFRTSESGFSQISWLVYIFLDQIDI